VKQPETSRTFPLWFPKMATLIKRENSPFWIAAFDVTLPDGSVRRLKKSTKKRKRAEAMVEAIRLEEVERKIHQTNPENTSKAYSILSEAAAAAAKGELSEGRARELLSRITEASTGEKLRFYTVRSWADDWISGKASRSKKSTMLRYDAHVKTFLAWLGPKADDRLESITKADIRLFRDSARKGWAIGLKPAEFTPRTAKTTNHYLADVAGVFRAAVREGILLQSPCSAIEKLAEDDSTEREVFTVAEVGALVGAAGDPKWQDNVFKEARNDVAAREARCLDWQGIILAGFYIGARLGDCARFTWENVDLDRNAISFLPEKTARKKKRLEVPLHPRFREYLLGREERAGPIFPSQFGSAVGGRHGHSMQFVAIMAAANIDRRTVRAGTKGGQRAQHARSFHALRHSLTSNLANLDVPEEIRRRIVGHESSDIHAKYTHTERETLARALEKLPSI
jgi:integrase